MAVRGDESHHLVFPSIENFNESGRQRRVWVPTLTLAALCVVFLSSTAGLVTSSLLYAGVLRVAGAGGGAACMAQSFVFFASLMAALFVGLYLAAARRNYAAERVRPTLQPPLYSWAVIVSRLALVAWAVSVVLAGLAVARSSSAVAAAAAAADRAHLAGNLAISVLAFVPMLTATVVLESAHRPFQLPGISPPVDAGSPVTCRVSDFLDDMVGVEDSVSRRGSVAGKGAVPVGPGGSDELFLTEPQRIRQSLPESPREVPGPVRVTTSTRQRDDEARAGDPQGDARVEPPPRAVGHELLSRPKTPPLARTARHRSGRAVLTKKSFDRGWMGEWEDFKADASISTADPTPHPSPTAKSNVSGASASSTSSSSSRDTSTFSTPTTPRSAHTATSSTLCGSATQQPLHPDQRGPARAPSAATPTTSIRTGSKRSKLSSMRTVSNPGVAVQPRLRVLADARATTYPCAGDGSTTTTTINATRSRDTPLGPREPRLLRARVPPRGMGSPRARPDSMLTQAGGRLGPERANEKAYAANRRSVSSMSPLAGETGGAGSESNGGVAIGYSSPATAAAYQGLWIPGSYVDY